MTEYCCEEFDKCINEEIIYLEDQKDWCFVIDRSGDPNFGFSLIIYYCPFCGKKL